MTSGLVAAGTLVPLNLDTKPQSFVARTDPDDVARAEDRTFLCWSGIALPAVARHLGGRSGLNAPVVRRPAEGSGSRYPVSREVSR
jgi:hypothetical protein